MLFIVVGFSIILYKFLVEDVIFSWTFVSLVGKQQILTLTLHRFPSCFYALVVKVKEYKIQCGQPNIKLSEIETTYKEG